MHEERNGGRDSMAPHDKAAEASSSHTTYDQQQEPEDLPPGYEEVAEVSA